MKAGGVQFADTPDEAERARRATSSALEINGHMPRGVLVDPKADGRAGVLRRRRLGRHPQAAGDALQRHGRHRHRGGRRGAPRPRRPRATSRTSCRSATSRPRRSSPRSGVTGSRLNRLVPILTAPRAAVRRARHDAGRDQPARRARGRLVRRARRAHGHGERGPRRARRRCSTSSASATRRRARRARRPPFELAGEAVDAMDHRGVAGNVTEFDGNLGLVIGAGGGSLTLFDAVRAHGGKPGQLLRDRRQPVGARRPCGLAKLVLAEAGRRQDRGDDVDRLQHARRHRRPRRHQGLPRARLRPGREDRDLPHPGRVGGGGLQDPRALRRRVRRPHRLDARGGADGRREDRGGGHERSSSTQTRRSSSRASPAARPSTSRASASTTARGAKIVGGVTPGRQGRDVHGVPVFDTVAQAVAHHGAADRRLGRHRPARLHQGRRLRGDRERHQARS